MNFLKISYDNTIYINMDNVQTITYDPKLKLISFWYDGKNVIDGFGVTDEIKLQLEKFGIYLNEVEK